jgi:hypothetical protein
MFRVVYPAAVSIDANDFNTAFKTAIKRQEFFNVEQMIIMDQLNQYRRANIMYSDMGGGKKKASIKYEPVLYPQIAPLLVGVGASGSAGMVMPLGNGLPPIVVPLGGEKKEDKPAADPAKPAEPAKDRVVIGPMGPVLYPANGANIQTSMLLPGSRQMVGVNPALPIGTNGLPVNGIPMGFGVSSYGAYPGVMQLPRPGLVPVANSFPSGSRIW